MCQLVGFLNVSRPYFSQCAEVWSWNESNPCTHTVHMCSNRIISACRWVNFLIPWLAGRHPAKLASYPGPAQLSIASDGKLGRATESWAGPGNEATAKPQPVYLALLFLQPPMPITASSKSVTANSYWYCALYLKYRLILTPPTYASVTPWWL